MKRFPYSFEMPRADTAILAPIVRDEHRPFKFGWFWEVTEDVEFVTSEMERLGQAVNVWETPQFKAIERLIGVNKLRFPTHFNQAFHGVFCRILVIEILLKTPVLTGDISDTLARLERASDHLRALMDELYGMHEDVINFLSDLPESTDINLPQLGKAELYLAYQIGGMKGALEAALRFRRHISERFLGKELSSGSGRPRNWVAEYIAMIAADIYRTVFPGPIKRTSKNDSKSSFQEFYDDFSQGIPDAMRADSRKLARHIWDGGYRGTPFAPVPERS